MELQPHQQRVVTEKAELDEKIGKLRAFFGTETFADLDAAEMERLQRQADHIAEPIAMMRGFPGAKPAKFCYWVFEGLNLTPDDEFHDLFPGSGAVGDAWQKWKNRMAPEQLELVGSNNQAHLRE